MQNFLGLVTALSTIALLIVTYWYARTTKAMALIAKDAADESAIATQAAERSAEAAREAAAVAQSQIAPAFVASRVAMKVNDTPTSHIPVIRLESTGDAVVVERVTVRRAFRASAAADFKPEFEMAGADLTSAESDAVLPKRLHKGERIHLGHPDLEAEGDDHFVRFLIDVDYKFIEGGTFGGTLGIVLDTRS